MILSKYIELHAPDNASARSYFKRVILAVHERNSAGGELVVDWPKWASSANYFGSIMRMFGSVEQLELLRARLKGIAWPKKGAPHVSAILDVPSGAKITWMFKRHRAPCRNRNAAVIARLQRRAIERGEQPKEYTPHTIETHTLMIVSLSSNTMFPLDICRARPTHLDALDCRPNSYGLGVPVPRF